MNIAVIGFGYWGPNLVKSFADIEGCHVAIICDLLSERLAVASKRFPDIQLTSFSDDLMNDLNIDAVVIATPVDSHYPLARKALLKGKHVLIEKPMVSSVEQAQELIEIAEKRNKVLMVDHTFLYNSAIDTISSLIHDGTIGKIHYFDFIRANLGLFQQDINVLWDLASHDISMLELVIEDKPNSVQAVGLCHTGNCRENIAYLTLKYDVGMIAHFNCSWISPLKLRRIIIGGDKKMIVFNDLDPTEKVKVYDAGYKIKSGDNDKILVDYRIGDIYTPKIEENDPLFAMGTDFMSAVTKGTQPISSWKVGLNVVQILEASDLSIKNNGQEIKL